MSLVKTKLFELYEQYSKSNTNMTSSSQQRSSSIIHESIGSGGGFKSKGKSIFDEIKAYESQTISNAEKSQLNLYLEKPKLKFAYYEELDIWQYWKNQKHQYPFLALMACDVLAIPITTVASESAFSIGAHVLTKYRSCTLPKKVQALICARNWLHRYVDDNEVNEDGASIKITLSCEGSNVFEIIDEDEEEDGDNEF